MAVSRILSWMIIYLIPQMRDAPKPIRRRSDRFSSGGATIPEDQIGPAVLPLFCLAPHGVFRAARITPRAVSSYLAFSPLPALLSKNRRCLFCDTFRQRPLSRTPPAYSTRHAAVWCSDFPPANLAIHQRSSAICGQFITIRKAGKQEENPVRSIWGSYLLVCVIRSENRLHPMREEEFLFAGKKMIRPANDRP